VFCRQYNTEDNPEALWKILSEKYRDPGVSGAFVKFKGVMDTVIPNNGDPSPALDKIMSHFVCLSEMSWIVPKNIQAMIILAKAPSSMEPMVQLLAAQVKEEKDKSKITPDIILSQMRLSWDTHGRTSASSKGKQNQQQAQKISAVHDGSGQPPSFQQQQQQHGDGQQRGGQGGGRGKTRRGNRGGTKNKKDQLQGAVADQQQQPPQPGPSQPGPSYPPNYPPPQPGYQWVQAPSQPQQDQYYGFFVNHIRAGRPLPSIPPLPYQSRYTSFNQALSLAHRLDVRPFTQTLKTLEGRLEDVPSDPRPAKRPRKELPHGEAQGKNGKVKDDEVVSLGESDPEFDRDPLFGDEVMDTQDQLFNNMDFGRDGEIDESSGLEMSLQVFSPHCDRTNTDNKLQLDNYIAVVSQNKFCCSCSHECDCKPKEVKEWIIDLGASSHFTNELSDFIEYEEYRDVKMVYTANSSARIVGKGTVIIVSSKGVAARIYPVYYVPGLSYRLLSLGTFLRQDLQCLGMERSIKLFKRQKIFMMFLPRNNEDTLYSVKSHVAKEAEIYIAVIAHIFKTFLNSIRSTNSHIQLVIRTLFTSFSFPSYDSHNIKK
jgi:hypothetical protein